MIPPIDQAQPNKTLTASFATGCFWGPDAEFGCTPGIIRTRVGYAGGAKLNPTYHDLGDHIETIQVDYDPQVLSFADLLTIFWGSHDATLPGKKQQYLSVIFYHDNEQKKLAEISLAEQQTEQPILTKILSIEPFYLAEDYHQKFRLRQDSRLFPEFINLYAEPIDLMNSTAAARVNGYLGGFGSPEQFAREMLLLGLSDQAIAWLQIVVEQYNMD